MKLIDIAKILRSKNAGPLYITFDIIFENTEDMKKVYASLTKEQVAKAYEVAAESITIIPLNTRPTPMPFRSSKSLRTKSKLFSNLSRSFTMGR